MPVITLTQAKTQKAAPIARFVFCAMILFLLFRYSEQALENMKRGLSICAEVLIPTLFPYMVISELLVRSDLGSYAARIFGKPMRRLFGVSGACAGALLLGILCGFPVGAKTAAALYEKGDISKDDAEALMTFCNYPSAPFMIFAVGESLFESRKLGIFLYLTVLCTGLMYGVTRHILTRKNCFDIQAGELKSGFCESPPFIKIFTDSVTSAAGSVIAVCAYVTFFTCTVGSLSAMLGGADFSPFKALLFSFFELTTGAAACAALDSPSLAAMLCAAAAGWSGVSVFLQIYSLSRTDREAISLAPYIQAKAVSSALCASITAAALRIFPSLIPVKESAEDVFLPTISFPAAFITAVNTFFILTALIYIYKKLDRRRKI